MKYVSNVGYLSEADFQKLPRWIKKIIIYRWLDWFGDKQFNHRQIFWYDTTSPVGYVFDYDVSPDCFLSDGDSMGVGTTTPTPLANR